MDIVLVGHIVDIVPVETNCAHQHSTILCFRVFAFFPDMTLLFLSKFFVMFLLPINH